MGVGETIIIIVQEDATPIQTHLLHFLHKRKALSSSIRTCRDMLSDQIAQLWRWKPFKIPDTSY